MLCRGTGRGRRRCPLDAPAPGRTAPQALRPRKGHVWPARDGTRAACDVLRARGAKAGGGAAAAAVVFWEAGPERPRGRGLPMLRSKLSSDRLPSEPPSPQGRRPTAGAPGAASPPGLDRRPRTAWCRGRGSAKPRRAHDRGQGHAGGPTQRQRPESAWGPFSPREARLETGLERGEGGPRWGARQPGEPSEHRAGTGHRGRSRPPTRFPVWFGTRGGKAASFAVVR